MIERDAHARPDQCAREHGSVGAVRRFGAAVCDCQLERGQPGAGAHRAARAGTGHSRWRWARARRCCGAPCWRRAWCCAAADAMAAVLLAVPMVEVLGHYAQRFSVRAADLTLDFSLVWFGAALALIAAVFLAYIPRLPSPDAPHGQPDRAAARAWPAQATASCAFLPSRRSRRRSCCLPARAC